MARCAPANRQADAVLDAKCERRSTAQADREYLAGPGKLNGYAPVGRVRADYVEAARRLFAHEAQSLPLDVDYADLAASAVGRGV